MLALRNGDSKLLPRSAADVVSSGVPVIVALEPALTFTRVGSVAAPTFPAPLTVRLSRAATAPTTVTVTSSAAGLVVADVVVPTGATSVVVPVTGVTMSATPYTVTATLDGTPRTAAVRVIGATEVPALTSLTPLLPTVRIDGMATFTVTLNLPAPVGGTTVLLASATGGTVPATVLIPADALSATFTFTAGAAVATVHVSATLDLAVFGTDVSVVAAPPADLVINEVDYDQVGTDTTEFIEIYNPSATARTLTGLSVVLINGSGATSIYGTYPLTGSLAGHAYLMLASAAVVVPAGTTVISLAAVQNGGTAATDPGDAIALIDTATGAVIDALSYESAITAAVTMGGPAVALVAGRRTLAADSNTAVGSLARLPNGNDSADDQTDWVFTSTVTPGAANL